MNRDIVQGNWKQFKGKVQVRWGMLIGDYLRVISGRSTQLAGERQQAYGIILSKTLGSAKKIRYSADSFSSNPITVGTPSPKASAAAVHTHETL